ncbi:hypothetical protein GCM10023219_13420 [Stakelama sediminis]|uniref:Curli assembly protein CsgC n=1 Tax=Stakelama sediminis TaxID=463200 RepID=A0A840YWN4_9SPHN|nr:curli-like amyloid fiber formation chaperone CsgH [Stakelama sediminis]MBB5718068.1 hypothetical protein [Stakelama sediminis]
MAMVPTIVFAAGLATMTMTASADDETGRPITLLVSQQQDSVELRVVGQSPEAVQAHYTLEVSGGDKSNSNRTVQRGSARLKPDQAVVLMTLKLGAAGGRHWHAVLKVEPEHGKAYELSEGR